MLSPLSKFFQKLYRKWHKNVGIMELLRISLKFEKINQPVSLLQNDVVADEEQLVQWPCSICTYLNEPNHVICEMCFTQRAGKKSKPKAQPQQPKAHVEQPKAQSLKFNARSEQSKARALPKECKSNSDQGIARSDQQLPEPVASSRAVNNAVVDSQRIVQQACVWN